jgi:Arc/MetJ family transcription regulator
MTLQRGKCRAVLYLAANKGTCPETRVSDASGTRTSVRQTGRACQGRRSLCILSHREPHIPTNLNLDDALLDEAVKLSGKKTKRDTVNAALQEYVSRRKQRRVLDLFGKLDWDPRYDYKKERDRA